MKSSKGNNPFVFGLTQKENAFTNRTEEINQLHQLFSNNINCILVSPRRWGKSSLVRECAKVLKNKEKKLQFCFLDMFSVNSEQEFYQEFATQLIKANTNKVQDVLSQTGTYFKKIVPKISLGLSPESSVSLSFDWQDVQKHKSEILDLGQKIAEQKKINLVVCIDEFQSLSRFDDPLQFQRSLRAVWQNHDKVSYCLYGSKRNMMEHIFNNRKMPFYRFGEFIPLQKIEEKHWIPFIRKGFKTGDKNISTEHIKWIVEKMDCHPYYVQQLSYHVWNTTIEEVTQEILDECLNRIIEHNAWMYEREVEGLSRTQLNLVKAIINKEEQLSSKYTLAKYDMGTSATVTKNKKILEQNDVIIKQNQQITMVDPVFVLWMKQRFDLNRY
ncbi:MAG: ATP-binding protein [Bacteroidetes bacterium]|nr:ATP-binding protein [Bacteroidota bacterium]